MQDYLAENWRTLFEHHGLRTFEDFWQRDLQWFEPPNLRRGGWSGVGRCELPTTDGGRVAIFVKRQENHVTRTWRHPLRGMATLKREFDALRRFDRCHLPTTAPLYFGQRRSHGRLRAILVTEELAGFRSLEALAEEWSQRGWPSLSLRRKVIHAIARVVRRMHEHRLQHNCLYPKHVFLRLPAAARPSGDVEVRMIDLEKTKRPWLRWFAIRRDLDTLHRHALGWTRTDRVRFLKAYLEGEREARVKRLWRALIRRAGKKSR